MKLIGVVLILLLFATGLRNTETGTLIVTISNIKKTGRVYVALYRKGEKFPSEKFVIATISGNCQNSCSLQFDAIPFGQYAVAVYQDLNSNKKLDTNILGIPSEPFAFSNNFRPKLGGPTFEKCKFDFDKDNQSIHIEIINSLLSRE